jgi:hypothetical protein
MTEEDIDYADIPPITKEQFVSAKPFLQPHAKERIPNGEVVEAREVI